MNDVVIFEWNRGDMENINKIETEQQYNMVTERIKELLSHPLILELDRLSELCHDYEQIHYKIDDPVFDEFTVKLSSKFKYYSVLSSMLEDTYPKLNIEINDKLDENYFDVYREDLLEDDNGGRSSDDIVFQIRQLIEKFYSYKPKVSH